jgi:hypothetical protein
MTSGRNCSAADEQSPPSFARLKIAPSQSDSNCHPWDRRQWPIRQCWCRRAWSTTRSATCYRDDAAAALLGGGVLKAPVWDRALTVFGAQGAREIVYLLGHYCFVSMTLNGFAIPVPDDR